LRIAQENLKLSEELYNFIKRLYELGETTKLELFRAERELQTAKTELELARVDYQNALRSLSSFVGREVQGVEGRIEELRDLEPLNPEDTPQVRYYQLAIDGVRKNIELEKLYAKPQVSIELLGEKVADKECEPSRPYRLPSSVVKGKQKVKDYSHQMPGGKKNKQVV